MFDLKFIKKLLFCIHVMTMHNPGLRLVTHQQIMKMKGEQDTNHMVRWDELGSEYDAEDLEPLMDYVYDEYAPAFGMKIVDPSAKLLSIVSKDVFKSF
jgi:hypothetical protein